MPIDYSKYPKNWKSEIRPAILARAGNMCEFCGVKNGLYIIRGELEGERVYEDIDGNVFQESDSEFVCTSFGEIDYHEDARPLKIVLTISHLDHNIENNNYDNLKALCQRCHLNHDRRQHRETRLNNKRNNKNIYPMFE